MFGAAGEEVGVVKEGGEEVRWSSCDAVRIVTAARAGGAQIPLIEIAIAV